MEDEQIVNLYWDRAENAIAETSVKYGRYCFSVAYRILRTKEDSDECVNDTWLKAWNVMPPAKPSKLRIFLGKITRNLALDRYRLYTREKRGGGQMIFALEELEECIRAKGVEGSKDNDPETAAERMFLTQLLNRFLEELPAETRRIFMQRYWYMLSIREISDLMKISESKVKMSLLRSRKKLKDALVREGLQV